MIPQIFRQHRAKLRNEQCIDPRTGADFINVSQQGPHRGHQRRRPLAPFSAKKSRRRFPAMANTLHQASRITGFRSRPPGCQHRNSLAAQAPGGLQSPQLSALLAQLSWLTLAGQPQSRFPAPGGGRRNQQRRRISPARGYAEWRNHPGASRSQRSENSPATQSGNPGRISPTAENRRCHANRPSRHESRSRGSRNNAELPERHYATQAIAAHANDHAAVRWRCYPSKRQNRDSQAVKNKGGS